MATCITKARSNYFSVTDVPAFLTIMQKWEKDFGIRIMKKRIDEDQTVYAFSYETTSVNINDALCDLQKILPEWEAVIIYFVCFSWCDWPSVSADDGFVYVGMGVCSEGVSRGW